MQFPTSTTRREMWLLGSQKDLAAQTQEFVVSTSPPLSTPSGRREHQIETNLTGRVPNGIRTRVAALKARNSAFLDAFQDLLLLIETCFDKGGR